MPATATRTRSPRALREATEETSLDPALIAPFGEWFDDHGGWSYTTIVARTDASLHLHPVNAESVAMSWWAFDDVDALPLHHGFAAAWPAAAQAPGVVSRPPRVP